MTNFISGCKHDCAQTDGLSSLHAVQKRRYAALQAINSGTGELLIGANHIFSYHVPGKQ